MPPPTTQSDIKSCPFLPFPYVSGQGNPIAPDTRDIRDEGLTACGEYYGVRLLSEYLTGSRLGPHLQGHAVLFAHVKVVAQGPRNILFEGRDRTDTILAACNLVLLVERHAVTSRRGDPGGLQPCRPTAHNHDLFGCLPA